VNIKNRLKKLERQGRPSGLREWWDKQAIRILDKDGHWPEEDEDRRLGRNLMLLVRGNNIEKRDVES
jgi:hypothetical protein